VTTSPVLDAYKLSDDILDLLDDAVMTYVTEAELQAEIARVLVAEGIDARREVRLSDGRSRIDLLCGRVGIEVKIKASGRAPQSSVARQLQRYAHCDEVDALILVTSSWTHLDLPGELAGVPVARIHMTGALQ